MKRILILLLLLSSIGIFGGAVSSEKKALPIVMYHSINKANINAYVHHPDNFENDLIWLKKHGYESVFSSDVINYSLGKGQLPSKPIMLFFDDGFYNNLVYALPLLQKHDFKAMIAVVGEFSDREKGQDQSVFYSNLTWEQVAQLSNSGNIEIVNHSYDLHCNKKGRQGVAKKKYESLEDYKILLSKDISKLQDKIEKVTGKSPKSFCYPYGKYCAESETVLQEMGFLATYTCNEHINYISKGCSLFALGRYNRPGELSTDYFFSKKMKLN